MDVRFGMAKVKKYAVSESGDTFEMVERPHGGLSFVLVDGQRSGKSAKSVSNLVSRKAIQLLGEGIRDGAAARAAHDYLFTYRAGKVSATLNIISVDTESKTFVISRNNEAPVIIYTPETGTKILDEPSKPIGTSRRTKPDITEMPLSPGIVIVAFTDGLRLAGLTKGKPPFGYLEILEEMFQAGEDDPQVIADTVLGAALAYDDGRPKDDVSVMVVLTVDGEQASDVRKLSGRMPVS